MKKTVEERFWEKVKKQEGDGCWEWTASHFTNGYGQFWNGERDMPAHRWSYEAAFGPIPKGLLVCHHCDNHLCVRPDHLFLGTHFDNTQDMVGKSRNRFVSHSGEDNGSAKLTEAQVREIKSDLALGASQRFLARKFGVTPQAIWLIKEGKKWGQII